MDAIYIVKNGSAEKAFERRAINLGDPGENEVQVEVEAFGLNFADVMARLGHYRDCPPLPAVVGYEAVGRLTKLGPNAKTDCKVGDRVIAFTRFGAYSQVVNTMAEAVVKIEEDYAAGKALALATQYCTAYYAAHVATNILPGEKVLIQAVAGGVGTALTQLCKRQGCFIYGTAGSDEKLDYAKKQGVDVGINYRTKDFSKEINEDIDVVFDSIGGKVFNKGLKLLNKGGRIVAYGGAGQNDATNPLSKIKFALDFGIFHPIQFLMNSRSLIGVNMLRIADFKIDIMQHCLQNVVQLSKDGEIDPHVGGMYPIAELNEAHTALETRKTIGKIGVYW